MQPRWIWQLRDWPCFRWDAEALQPLLLQASAALISRESLSTAAIEGE